jgi:formylmethanofuran dehydrogenase subunit A
MLRIINGQVYDPANEVGGNVRDVYIEDSHIVPTPAGQDSDSSVEILDAAGCVVMPGGVEIHTHMAGPKVNNARIMCPEDHYDDFYSRTLAMRSGTGHTVPSTFLTGYQYAGLGYTTAFEAAVPALKARHAHEELRDIPLLDTGIYTLMGNNYMIMKVLSEPDSPGRKERLRAVVSWLLRSSKGYAVKVVNPGGVENWKWSQGAAGLDTPVPPFGVTPRQILMELADTVEELRLPHPLHLHCNRLGEPGNVETTLETMRSLAGRRLHLTHIQFHSYGRTKKGGISSAAPQIAECLSQHPEFTCDVGQIVFGPATTMTADSPMQYRLHELSGHKWASFDIEMETGSGIVPLAYRPEVLTNAIQWCIGLELFLLVKNPWQVFLTTDHPNAGPFVAYPHIIRLLMDAPFRRAWLEKLHPRTKRYTNLAEIDREYTLNEIAIVTRAGQARTLGLRKKGHLGAGAQADVAIYRLQDDKEAMFSRPAYVLKDGEVIVRDGRAIKSFTGRTFFADPDRALSLPSDLIEVFDRYYSIALSNYPVEDEYIARPEAIPCI